MKRFLASLAVATVALSPMAWLGSHSAAADTQSSFVYSCAQHAAPGFASCFAIRRAGGLHDSAALGTPAVSVPGFHPADLQSAYNLTAASAANGGAQTVAIVDAYDDPTAESDLAVYRSTFGLPACTTANGCFKKVNQYGGTTYPRGDTGWAGEISLDVDMVSAICPNCHILLVEASSNSNYNLGVAVYVAAKYLGANVISNSYGGSESSADVLYDKYFYNHPGVILTASTGDSGYGAEYPAASPYVTAVGGTSLHKNSQVARGWSETAWSCYGSFSCSFNGGTGSGCSAYSAKPSWQVDTGCSKRTAADVSAVADPNTGVSVYQTYGGSGWAVYGGTSVASPVIAAVYALAGNAASLNYASSLYSNTGSLNDVTSGTNAIPPACSYGNYLCTAGTGYDGPTGLGTPNGLGAF